MWLNHERARAWAKRVLTGVTTVAVDGSQITPTRTISAPVGAVQIGWFINPHSTRQPYVKDIAFEVLAPDELADEDEAVTGFPDWRVNQRRFERECQRLITLMQAFHERARPETPTPVFFFDGSLILSFAAQMRPARQRPYVQAVRALLAASERYRVPVVGYVDVSYAKDLISMLGLLVGRSDKSAFSDGALLRSRMGWGDRTTAWICARDDGLSQDGGPGGYYDQVAFVYLKTTADRPPARLDLPRWLLAEKMKMGNWSAWWTSCAPSASWATATPTPSRPPTPWPSSPCRTASASTASSRPSSSARACRSGSRGRW